MKDCSKLSELELQLEEILLLKPTLTTNQYQQKIKELKLKYNEVYKYISKSESCSSCIKESSFSFIWN